MPLAIEVAFVLLSVAMLADWLGHRERRRGYLALAFGSLTLLVLVAPSLSQDGTYGPLLTDVGVLLFLFSGWALLMFRDSFIPLRSRTRAWRWCSYWSRRWRLWPSFRLMQCSPTARFKPSLSLRS